MQYNILKLLSLSILLLPISVLANVEGHPFLDYQEATHYESSVNALYNLGILTGYEDGTFGFNQEINRAEFLKIALESANVKGANLEIQGSNCYPDVQTQWFAPYVCKATELGLVNGYEDGYFRPEKNINLHEASKIIVNVFDLEICTDEKCGQEIMQAYSQEWYQPYLFALSMYQALPSSFQKTYDLLDRSEMAEIINIILTDYKPEYSLFYFSMHDAPDHFIETRRSEWSSFGVDETLNTELQERFANAFNQQIMPLVIQDKLDADTLEEVLNYYGRFTIYCDKNGLYIYEDGALNSIIGVDPNTIDLALHGSGAVCEYPVLFRDKDYVYDRYFRLLKGVDPDSFRSYNGSECTSFFIDKNHVYYYRTDAFPALVQIEGADPNTIQVQLKWEKLNIDATQGTPIYEPPSYYIYDSEHIWIYDTGSSKITKLEGSPATFDF